MTCIPHLLKDFHILISETLVLLGSCLQRHAEGNVSVRVDDVLHGVFEGVILGIGAASQGGCFGGVEEVGEEAGVGGGPAYGAAVGDVGAGVEEEGADGLEGGDGAAEPGAVGEGHVALGGSVWVGSKGGKRRTWGKTYIGLTKESTGGRFNGSSTAETSYQSSDLKLKMLPSRFML